jgi:hypothetical protein
MHHSVQKYRDLSAWRIMMKAFQATRSREISADASTIWSVLSDDFVDISKWARAVRSSRPNPAAKTVPAGASTGGRVCDVEGMGVTDELITEFDAAEMRIAYSLAAAKLPGFVRNPQTAWKVERLAEGRSRVTVTATSSLAGLMGTVMRPMLRKKFGSTLEGLLADLGAFVETGSPSEAKATRLARA